MATKRKAPEIASCAECGTAFETTRKARFCCDDHKAEYRKRLAIRGKVLTPYVLAWIEGRGGGHAGTHPVGGPSMREITSIARSFIDEDRKKGRPSAIPYVERLLAEGLYIDRRSTRREG